MTLTVINQRPVVQLLTIEQWLAADQQTRTLVLNNIRLASRLHRWLEKKQTDKNAREQLREEKEPRWVPCRNCNAKNESPQNERGWILLHPRYDGIHPSQFGEPCLLKIYNEMIGVPKQEKFEPRKQLIFDFGSALHNVFQTYGEMGAWGPLYTREVPINREHQELAAQLMLEGAADAENILVIDDIPNESRIFEVGLIHEYKSINDNGYSGLRAPYPKHQQQASLYSAARNRPVTLYLYMNKNDSNLKDFPVPFDPSRWQALYNKGTTLVHYYHQQIPPPADVGFHCRECAYYFSCPPAKEAAQKAAILRKKA